jgi:branched-chain amino acid transport system permease protein
MTQLIRGKAWLAIPLGAALVFPFLTDNMYFLSVVIWAIIVSIAVYGLNVLISTGQLSLAHGGFFGIGAYTTGILTTTYGVNFWLALPASLVVCAALGFLVGMVALRTRGSYFAIFTLAVGVMIMLIIDHWDDVTGGTDGMIGVPPVSPIGPLRFESLVSQYYLNLVFLLLTIILAWNLGRSLVGRTFLAVRNDEQLAQAIGINVGRAQRLSFTITTTIAGLSGALYAPYLGYLGPSLSGLEMTFNMLLYLMIGGAASLSGPLIGTFLLITLTQGLQIFEGYQLVILGPLLIVSIIFFPQGIAGLIGDLSRRFRPPGRPTSPIESPPKRTVHRDDAYAAPRAEPGD